MLLYCCYRAGRDVYQQLTPHSQFSERALVERFGKNPALAFTKVQHQLMLQLLSGLFSSKQLMLCSAAMFGGRLTVDKSGGTPRMVGGKTLKLKTQLGRGGAEALAPYLRANTTLRCIVLSETQLGNDGVRILADAVFENTTACHTITHLDLSGNSIGKSSGDGLTALCKVLSASR
jgi:hypothetical protein